MDDDLTYPVASALSWLGGTPNLRAYSRLNRLELFGIRFRDDKGSCADFRCEGPGLLKLTKRDATAVAGTFKCQEHDVKFDAAVLPASGK